MFHQEEDLIQWKSECFDTLQTSIIPVHYMSLTQFSQGLISTTKLLPKLRLSASMAHYYYKPLTYHDGDCVDFRLLTLEPGRKNESLCASLWHASLDQPPSYEALSYVWGNAMVEAGDSAKVNNFKKSQVITLDGCLFPIGENLYSALIHLTNEMEPRTLWVDAICINQDDSFERGRQVRIMSQIYAKSSSVLAWLGVADEDSDITMCAIEDICWAVKVHLLDSCAMSLGISFAEVTDKEMEDVIQANLTDKDRFRRFMTGPFAGLFPFQVEDLLSALRRIQVNIPSDCRSFEDLSTKYSENASFLRNALLSAKLFTEMSSSSSLKAIAHSTRRFFRNRNYWKRLWVVQEAFFAPDLRLVCGSTTLHGTRLLIIHKLVLSYRNRPTDEFSAIMLHFAHALLRRIDNAFPHEIDQLLNRDRSRRLQKLYSNMTHYRGRFCTESVDIIFALLNISQPINVQPDYEKSCEDIFIDTTKAIIEQEQSLNVICRAANDEKLPLSDRSSSPELPSFVPHYEARLHPSVLVYHGIQTENQPYHTGGPLMSEYRRNTHSMESDRTLLISGCFWGGTVRETLTLGLFDSSGMLLEHWLSIKKWYFDLRSALGRKFNSTIIEDWRMIFGDMYICSRDHQYDWERTSVHKEAFELLEHDVTEALSQDDPKPAFLNWLRISMHDNSIYTTDQGYFVKAPRRVRIGDEIFVARGCSIAMVLRPVSEAQVQAATGHLEGTNNPVRQFVAGAYVHGIMDGEAIQQVNDGNVEEQEVLLI